MFFPEEAGGVVMEWGQVKKLRIIYLQQQVIILWICLLEAMGQSYPKREIVMGLPQLGEFNSFPKIL